MVLPQNHLFINQQAVRMAEEESALFISLHAESRDEERIDIESLCKEIPRCGEMVAGVLPVRG